MRCEPTIILKGRYELLVSELAQANEEIERLKDRILELEGLIEYGIDNV